MKYLFTQMTHDEILDDSSYIWLQKMLSRKERDHLMVCDTMYKITKDGKFVGFIDKLDTVNWDTTDIHNGVYLYDIEWIENSNITGPAVIRNAALSGVTAVSNYEGSDPRSLMIFSSHVCGSTRITGSYVIDSSINVLEEKSICTISDSIINKSSLAIYEGDTRRKADIASSTLEMCVLGFTNSENAFIKNSTVSRSVINDFDINNVEVDNINASSIFMDDHYPGYHILRYNNMHDTIQWKLEIHRINRITNTIECTFQIDKDVIFKVELTPENHEIATAAKYGLLFASSANAALATAAKYRLLSASSDNTAIPANKFNLDTLSRINNESYKHVKKFIEEIYSDIPMGECVINIL